jgi:hypothetical protein
MVLPIMLCMQPVYLLSILWPSGHRAPRLTALFLASCFQLVPNPSLAMQYIAWTFSRASGSWRGHWYSARLCKVATWQREPSSDLLSRIRSTTWDIRLLISWSWPFVPLSVEPSLGSMQNRCTPILVPVLEYLLARLYVCTFYCRLSHGAPVHKHILSYGPFLQS